MFYDLEDPIAFTKGLRKILSPDGIWIFEILYMPKMLKMNSHYTIRHEHLENYRYATPADNYRQKTVSYQQSTKTFRQEELDLELDTDEPYENFQDHIKVHTEESTALLKKEENRIHICGASTRGNAILRRRGIDQRIYSSCSRAEPC